LETAAYRERLEELEEASTGDASVQEQISELRKQLDELEKASPSPGSTGHRADPDDSRRIVEDYKTIRGRLGGLERNVIPNREALATKEFIENVEAAEKVIGQFGTSLDQQQLARFRRELERVGCKGDDKAIQRVCAEIESLRWRVLFRHDWYWKDILDSLCEPETPFVNRAEAQILISKGQEAATSGDGEALREAVRGLWKLQPKREAETMRDRSIGSGLRRF
jgi:DNA repair exonuclease SbcCD ATPase subunit